MALFSAAARGLSAPARERRPAPRAVLTTAVSAEKFGKWARLGATALTALIVPFAQLPLSLSVCVLMALCAYGWFTLSRSYHRFQAIIIGSDDSIAVHRVSAIEPEPVSLVGVRLVSPALVALRVRAGEGGAAQMLCIWWDQTDGRSHRLLRTRLRHLRDPSK